jgi:hypothetical protein
MKVIKVNGQQKEAFASYKEAREEKNTGERKERNQKKVLELSVPELTQKVSEVSFMFNGKPIATLTQGVRNDVDRTKLQVEFPDVYAKVYLPLPVWKLDVLI